MKVEFKELIQYKEGPGARGKRVTCGFTTERFGILQVGRDGEKMVEYSSEPNLHNFTPAERAYIDEMTLIVYRLVFDARMPETFK